MSIASFNSVFNIISLHIENLCRFHRFLFQLRCWLSFFICIYFFKIFYKLLYYVYVCSIPAKHLLKRLVDKIMRFEKKEKLMRVHYLSPIQINNK